MFETKKYYHETKMRALIELLYGSIAVKEQVLSSEIFLWVCLPDFVDLVIFCIYTIGSLHKVFYFENWPDALCCSCVSYFLLARSALCSLLQPSSKINH